MINRVINLQFAHSEPRCRSGELRKSGGAVSGNGRNDGAARSRAGTGRTAGEGGSNRNRFERRLAFCRARSAYVLC